MVNGYTPINKKLLCFPYNYLLLSNNSGNSNALHYERFLNDNVEFKIKGVPTVGCSIKCSPIGYDVAGVNEEQGIMLGKFPTLNWSQDNYQIWLRQNALNLNLGIGSGIAQMVLGGLTSSPDSFIDMETQGIGRIFYNMKENYLHTLEPNSARGNVNGADINFCDDKNNFFFYHMSIKSEMAQKIDKFFSMFGYKVNEVKLPNINGRTNWNYVKTDNAIVESSIVPDRYLKEFKEMLNNGITFWHNPSTFLDYSQSNSIV